MTFHSVPSFITGEIFSFASLIGRTIFFHSKVLSFVLQIGYVKNQCELYSLRFSWINLRTYEIEPATQQRQTGKFIENRTTSTYKTDETHTCNDIMTLVITVDIADRYIDLNQEACFSKVPRAFRTRKASQTSICLF